MMAFNRVLVGERKRVTRVKRYLGDKTTEISEETTFLLIGTR